MDARELEKCIEEFGTDIYRFCLKLCADKQDAEDLYQQTFLQALEKEWRLDWENNPRALFFSLTYNIWKSNRRKVARRASIAPCGNIDEEQVQALRSLDDTEEDFFHKELLAEVNKRIETLPDKIRVPFTLYYVFEFSIEQAAEVLGKPPGTIKSRLHKGRQLMKKGLEEAGYGM